MTIGERIKKRRTDFMISQTDLAKKVGIAKQTLYKYETNIITNIPSDTIERIASVLNVSPAYIMGWERKESAPKNSPKIIKFYNQLNDVGKHEATKRVEELTYIERYTSNNHLLPNAAHERTDIEITEEMRQYDEDIMDDENF